jgi:hypothetical protein
MIRKALLVGINAYDDSPLSGCVNDAIDLRAMLISRGWESKNIRMLCDHRATDRAMRERLRWLTYDTKSDAQLVFGFSGHGTQLRDRSGDEDLLDHKDEALCPIDYDDIWDNPFIDDVLADEFKRLGRNQRLTVVLDCCHSGTGTRAVRNPEEIKTELTPMRRAKFVRAPIDVELRAEGCTATRRLGVKRRGLTFDTDPAMRHVLIAACQSNQTAADAQFGDRPNGALTRHLLNAFKTLGPAHTWVDIMLETARTLKADGFEQTPALEGMASLINGYPDF